MPNQLEQRIAQFTAWRENLVKSIDEFRTWQDAYGQADIELTLRIYDLVEGLRNDAVCEDTRIREWLPRELLGFRDAVRLALARGSIVIDTSRKCSGS